MNVVINYDDGIDRENTRDCISAVKSEVGKTSNNGTRNI